MNMSMSAIFDNYNKKHAILCWNVRWSFHKTLEIHLFNYSDNKELIYNLNHHKFLPPIFLNYKLLKIISIRLLSTNIFLPPEEIKTSYSSSLW